MPLFGLTPQKDKAPPAGAGGAAPGAAPGGPAPGGSGGDILDVTDASFMKDVIEESRTRPVVIDFWAPWCGPCRQLGPALERAVTAAKGKVRLAKVDIDKNPAIAQQFRVQSIPAVFVIDGGKAFQGFTGALPDSQVKAFVDELAASSGALGAPGGAEGDAPTLEEVLQIGAEMLAEGDAPGAAQAYAQALQMAPGDFKAIAGLARCYLVLGDPERAAEIAAMAPRRREGRRAHRRARAARPAERPRRRGRAAPRPAPGRPRRPPGALRPRRRALRPGRPAGRLRRTPRARAPRPAAGTRTPRASSSSRCSRRPAMRRRWPSPAASACPR